MKTNECVCCLNDICDNCLYCEENNEEYTIDMLIEQNRCDFYNDWFEYIEEFNN